MLNAVRLWNRISTAPIWGGHLPRLGLRALRIALAIGLVGCIVWQLGKIGWENVLRSLPGMPTFYLLLLVLYFTAPLAELLIYSRIWRVTVPLRVFLQKRFINNMLFDYSGEAFLFLWAKRHLAIPQRLLAHSIKDSGILSAAVGLLVLAALLLGLDSTKWLRVALPLNPDNWPYVLLACTPLLLVAFYVFAHRRMTTLSSTQIGFVFSVHAARSVIMQSLHVALWMSQIPSVPLEAWLNFLAARLVVSRIPLLPHKEVAFLGASIGIAGLMQLPHAETTAVLLTVFVGEQVFNLLFLGLPALVRSMRHLQGGEVTRV